MQGEKKHSGELKKYKIVTKQIIACRKVDLEPMVALKSEIKLYFNSITQLSVSTGFISPEMCLRRWWKFHLCLI